MADYLNIAGRVRTTASDGVAMEAQEVKDLTLNKSQQEINADVQTELGDRYTKEETYSKEQLDELITTPDVNYVSVVATNATTAVTDILPATGEANTIYRAGNWNGTQYDPTMYALFAWNGTTYVCLTVRSFVGEVYDISVNHPDGQGNPTPYADLAAALGSNGENIPADIRRGGMSIKFIQSSDNKYVQYRLKNTTWSTTICDWEAQDNSSLIKEILNIQDDLGIEDFDFSSYLLTGYYYDAVGKLRQDSNSGYTEKIDVPANAVGKYVKVVLLWGRTSNQRAFLLYNSENTLIEYKQATAGGSATYPCVLSFTTKIESGMKLAISFDKRYEYPLVVFDSKRINSIENDITTIQQDVTTIQQSVISIQEDVSNIEDEINGSSEKITLDYSSYVQTGYFYNYKTTELEQNSNSEYTPFITIPDEFVGHNLTFKRIDGLSSNQRACLISDANDVVKEKIVLSGTPPKEVTTARIIQQGDKIAISYDKRYTPIEVSAIITVRVGILERLDNLESDVQDSITMYISPSGSDENIGLSSSSPKKTIGNCLENGASKIMVATGEYDEYSDLSRYNRNIKIIALPNAAPIFMNRVIIADNGQEQQDSQYTNVYSISLTSEPDTDWLYQHLVDDINTEVSFSEINPLQRGKTYRCDSTRIRKVSSSITSLSEAKEYINTQAINSDYYWYYDSGVLYFSRPQESSAQHPIVKPVTSSHALYSNNSVNSILLSGLNFYYGNCEFYGCDNILVQNCSAKYVASNGAFRWSRCRNITFVKCEAARAKTENGDGFNGGSAGTALLPVHSSVYLIDCWAHDNNDDGYSDHDGCEAQVIRGLYEYNQKAGITPSYGSHCVATQVISRRNVNGFFYTGTLRGDLGLNGNALFVECLAENNTQSGFRVNGVGNDNVPNSIECIDCVSIGNSDGYRNNENNGQMILRDCKAKNNTNNVNGTATIINSQLLSE